MLRTPLKDVATDEFKFVHVPSAKLDRAPVFFRNPGDQLGDWLVMPSKRKAVQPTRPKVNFIGIDFHDIGYAAALETLLDRVDGPEFQYVVTPNVDHVITRLHPESGRALEDAYDNADLILCDSRVLSLMASLSNIQLSPVPGSDMTYSMLQSFKPGTSVAVVGGTPGMKAKLQELYPHLAWSFMHPPMGILKSEKLQREICDFVVDTAAAVTFFAIGAPQSEIICNQIKRSKKASGLALCVGASLEFITGEKTRAPLWMRKLRFEWLHRLICEPQRLAHRYLWKGPRIFVEWARWSRARNKAA